MTVPASALGSVRRWIGWLSFRPLARSCFSAANESPPVSGGHVRAVGQQRVDDVARRSREQDQQRDQPQRDDRLLAKDDLARRLRRVGVAGAAQARERARVQALELLQRVGQLRQPLGSVTPLGPTLTPLAVFFALLLGLRRELLLDAELLLADVGLLGQDVDADAVLADAADRQREARPQRQDVDADLAGLQRELARLEARAHAPAVGARRSARGPARRCRRCARPCGSAPSGARQLTAGTTSTDHCWNGLTSNCAIARAATAAVCATAR